MSEPKCPKGERPWVGYYDTKHDLRYLITSKTNDRSYYFLYEVANGVLKRLGKSRSPKELEKNLKFTRNLEVTVNDFDYDCYQRKQIAQQARRRKCGSKSRRCNLPSDNITKKQWKERNGKTVSVNMNQPLSWEMFKSVSKPTQEEYLTHLLEVFCVNATSLADMFKVRPAVVRRYIQNRELAVIFPVGRSMNAAQRTAWEHFLEGGEVAPDAPLADRPTEDIHSEKTSATTMKKVSLTFSGKIDISMIANSLRHILGENATGEVEISCQLL